MIRNQIGQREIFAVSECLRDFTFVWTEHINIWFRTHETDRNIYIALSSFALDIMIVIYLILFWLGKGPRTFRLCQSLLIFYAMRQFMQAIFLLGRPEGFLWSYPGIRSLVVNYHDTNDFYFSGHIGITALFSAEFYSMKWMKASFLAVLMLINMWTLLMLLRTHYVIDFISALVFARISHYYGEKLSFFVDVKVLGYRRQSRHKRWFDPCPRCGWGNKYPEPLVDADELQAQKRQEFSEQRQLKRKWIQYFPEDQFPGDD